MTNHEIKMTNQLIQQINLKKKILRALVVILELLIIGLAIYLIALPFYPLVKYQILTKLQIINSPQASDISQVIKETEKIINHLPQADYSVSPNRIIITKIGVNAPIIESTNANYALARGAWRVPESSTPDQVGNVVITGHRFKYLPPSNLTFYLLDKLEKEDLVSLVWQGKNYYYQIKEIKVVDKHDFSILATSQKPILTIFTCDPIYSDKNRLVVIAELVKDEKVEK